MLDTSWENLRMRPYRSSWSVAIPTIFKHKLGVQNSFMSLLRQEERGNLSEPIDLLLVTIAMSSVIACLKSNYHQIFYTVIYAVWVTAETKSENPMTNSWVWCSFPVRTLCNVKHTIKDLQCKRRSVLLEAPHTWCCWSHHSIEIAACIKYHEDLKSLWLGTWCSHVWRIDSVDKKLGLPSPTPPILVFRFFFTA